MKVFCAVIVLQFVKTHRHEYEYLFECSFRIYFNTVPNLYYYLSLSIIYLFCIFRVSNFLFKCLVSLKEDTGLWRCTFEFDPIFVIKVIVVLSIHISFSSKWKQTRIFFWQKFDQTPKSIYRVAILALNFKIVSFFIEQNWFYL